MRRLFWKIFAWFWGAMVLIGAALYLTVLTAAPDPMPAPWRESAAQTLAAYAANAVRDFESGGQRSLRAYLSQIGSRSFSHFWLFDAGGRELSGLPIPPPGPDQSLLPPLEKRPPPQRGPLENAARIETLRRRAAQNERTVFEHFKPRVLAATRVRSASGKTYVLVASLLEPRFERQLADPRRRLLGGALLLALSTLVCYGLVRYLTAPLIELRDATQRLAAGDLAARTGAAQKKRRDEVADLSRDFDAMAARIEVLLASQRRLLGDVSHELRSPLARLSLALGLARRHAQNGAIAELDEDFNRIAREKERLNELIGGLLEWTRLESGAPISNGERLDLTELIAEIVADADYEARQTGRHVLTASSAPCFVNGSRELLRRAVENVVRNAIRYAPADSAVEIALLPEGDECVLRVRDAGPGVPEESLAKLFDPFYRVERARDRDSGGVGLGLAIAAHAIAAHGGTIEARNLRDGGLEIEMRLPMAGP